MDETREEQLQRENARLREKLAELEALSDKAAHAGLTVGVCNALARGETPAEILKGCAQAIVDQLGASFSRIWLYDRDSGQLVLTASAGIYTRLDGKYCRINLGEGNIGQIATTLKPRHTNDILSDPLLIDRDWARDEGMVSFAGAPLVHDGKLVGVVALFSKKRLSDYTLSAISSFAENIAYIVVKKRESAELSNFFDMSPDMMCIAAFDGYYKRINPAFVRVSGYTEEEILSTPVLDFVHPDDHAASSETFSILSRGEPLSQFHNRFRKQDGTYMHLSWVAIAPEADGNIYAIARDITRQVETEEALRYSEEKFRNIVEESLLGAFAMQDGRFIYTNRGLSEICGYTAEEFLDKDDIFEHVYPEDREKVRGMLDELASGTAHSLQGQFRACRKDGSVIHVDVLGWSRQYKEKPTIIGTVMDITDRKRAEKDKSALVHMMTHDIKGPLTVIDGYCDILSGMVDGEPGALVGEIKKASNRISVLIKDMLDLSRLEAGKLEMTESPVDIRDLVESAVERGRMHSKSSDVTVRVEQCDGPLVVNADHEHLARAIDNLVSNAVKFSRRRGEVLVRCGSEGRPPVTVYVEVSDRGLGISEEDLPHVFEKYYRSKKTGAVLGSGLGLAIVRAITEAHCGRVEVTSREGEGSTFRLVLPASDWSGFTCGSASAR